MSFGNISDNKDGSKNFKVGKVKEDGLNTTTASLFVNNQRDDPKSGYGDAGGNLSFQHAGNPSASGSVTVQHIPKMGNQANVAAGLGVGSETHRIGVDAFTTHTMPRAHPNYTTVGANVNAQAGKVGVHAGITHTPMFKQTQHSVGTSFNVHESPTSSVDVGFGSSRMTTPNYKGNWNHGVNFGVRKNF